MADLVTAGARRSLASVLLRSYSGRRVLVTGHNGFVGSWLCLLLVAAGATVTGLSLDPEPGGLADSIALGRLLDERGGRDLRGDVRDAEGLAAAVAAAQPEVVIHLAAQALVFASYDDPLTTWATNVMGTANLLEALRRSGSARACVIVTSDKCYRTTDSAQIESDPLGGDDPYSASKACAELVVHAYASSYFAAGRTALATARAGNIVGGGDVAPNRVVPDCARAAVAGRRVDLRHPEAVRPWQHVLDAVAGYLRLGDGLAHDPASHAGAWNFGPDPQTVATVGEVADLFAASWSHHAGVRGPKPCRVAPPAGKPERAVLTLSSEKARRGLGWVPLVDLASALDWSVEYYEAASRPGVTPTALRALLGAQLDRYLALDSALGLGHGNAATGNSASGSDGDTPGRLGGMRFAAAASHGEQS
jgi:CDP-glucose 4,6-dehydratase